MKRPKKTSRTNSEDTALIAVWMPVEMVRKIDQIAKARDLDRSKLIRRAIRTELGHARPA